MRQNYSPLFRSAPAIGLSILSLLTLTGCARTSFQVLKSSTDLRGSPKEVWVKSIKIVPRTRQIRTTDRSGRSQWLPQDSVWGYRTTHGETYRLFERSPYQLVDDHSLFIYRVEEWWGGSSSWVEYYFSFTANSPIYSLSKPVCEQVFRRDSCTLAIIKQMRSSQLTLRDAHGSMGLSTAYRFCHPPLAPEKHHVKLGQQH
jgi:hypothetical protein